MKWEIVEVNHFCETRCASIKTGPFGTQLKASEYSESGTPVINVRNLGFAELRKDEKLEYLPPEKAAQLSGHILMKEDIVFGRKGAVDRHLLVNEDSDGWIQGSDCIRLRFSSDRVFPRFVSHFFCTREHKRWMENHCSFGSTMASLNESIVRKIRFPLPPLPTQQKIASILSAYDDLIENNLKRIRLLEEAAQHLYREWFVRFRFPGWEEVEVVDGLPVGWGRKRADEVFEISIGKTPPRKESQWFEDGISGIKWVSIRDMNASSAFISETSESITSEGVNKFNMNIAPSGTVILSFKLSVGAVSIVTEDMVTNEAIAHFKIQNVEKMNSFFTYWYLKNFNFETLGSTSSIGTAINSKIVKSLPFLVPEKEVIQHFEKVMSPFFGQIKNLLRQNQKLKAARDILLPRLMNQTIEL